MIKHERWTMLLRGFTVYIKWGVVKKLLLTRSALLALIALASIFANCSFADQVESELPFFCNPLTGALFITGSPEEQPDNLQNYRKQKVDWLSLLKSGQRRNQWGDPLRSGSRTTTKKCGSITLIFSSGFLNSNPQGELGALDFPVVELRKGKKVLLAKTALEQCDVRLSRYNHFGPCPDNWASRIEVIPTSNGHKVQVKRMFTDEAFNEAERIDIYE